MSVNGLFLVDGTNMVMRCAYRRKPMAEPLTAAAMACDEVIGTARAAGCSHAIVCFDHEDPSWRRLEYRLYKDGRTTNTRPYVEAFEGVCDRRGLARAALSGYEADDLIGAYAQRVPVPVTILSNDNDLLVLVSDRVRVVQLEDAAKATKSPYRTFDVARVCAKYGLAEPKQLTDFKTLVGESGDNVPGIPKVGPVRARRLLAKYGTVEGIIAHMRDPDAGDAALLIGHATWAYQAKRLLTLSTDAPAPPIPRARCQVPRFA